jgi:hypothetical protein
MEGRFPTLDTEAGWPATELRWAMKMSHVKLSNGEKETATKAA